MSKNNIDLVEYAKAQLGKPYWFGTYGQIASASVWTSKARQYPNYYTNARSKVAPSHYGQKVHDCAGLIKGYLWSENATAPALYTPSQDLSADMMYEKATKKGTIDTIPEIIGLGVWRKGHIGIYIGNGEVIEAKGFEHGVIKSKLQGSTFKYWIEIPFIEYCDSGTVADSTTTAKPPRQDNLDLVAEEVIQGKWGNGSYRRKLLTSAGYDYNEIQALVNLKLKGTFKPWLGRVRVNTVLNIREANNTNSAIVGQLHNGDKITILEEANGWGRIDRGWVCLTYVRKA